MWELDECRRKPTINTLSSKIFRNSKSNWKKIYNKFTTDDARKAAQPSDLSHKEWSDLLEHWGDPEHQVQGRRLVNRCFFHVLILTVLLSIICRKCVNAIRLTGVNNE